MAKTVYKSQSVLDNKYNLLKLVGCTIEDNAIKYQNNDEEFIVLDTETSGLDTEKDKIVQFSGIKYKSVDGKLNEIDRLDLYINQPEYDENKVIKGKNGQPDTTFGELTGITNAMLAESPDEEDAFYIIKDFIGDNPIFICYNTPFDYKMLCSLYIRYGQTLMVAPERKLDVLVMAKDLVDKESAPILLDADGKPVTDKSGKEKRTWKLSYIAELYGVDKEEGSAETIKFHSSINDVIVTGRLLNTFISEYAEQYLEESFVPVVEKTRAKVQTIRYWPGFRGFARFYITAILNDEKVSYFFDVRNKKWGEKDEGILDATLFDEFKQDVFDLAKVESEEMFAKLKLTDAIVADETFSSRYV